MRNALWILLALWIGVAPAGAVIIDSGDGTGNTGAPTPEDPGWAYVGWVPGFTAVYLGSGWAMTAAHGRAGLLNLPGGAYDFEPGSEVVIGGEGGPGVEAELRLFRIVGDPGLPPLPIRKQKPALDADVILIGHGRNRGPAQQDCASATGWTFGPGSTMRWGTNRVAALDVVIDTSFQGFTRRTLSFATRFDAGLPTPHESQAAPVDSGGAVFAKHGGVWELAGLMFATTRPCEANLDTAIHGADTYMTDLSHYRAAMFEVMYGPSVPALSSWGVPAACLGLCGAGLVALRRGRP